MKNLNIILIVMLTFVSNSLFAQYDKYFENKAMRFDFMHAGDKTSENYYYVGVTEEDNWGGSRSELVDSTNYGVQMFKIIDFESKDVIFSKGYCTLFNEWLDTEEALTTKRSYSESFQFPYPKAKVIVEIYSRSKKDNKFIKKFEQVVDPAAYTVSKRSPKFKTFDIQYNGHYSKKVDIVILSEGYDSTEEALFKADCKKFVDDIFVFSPFKERRKDFNVRAVWTPSKQSGITIPGENIWKETAFSSNFYTFFSERYFTIENGTKICEAAGNVPYDAIYILGNTLKYGGGGIYNFYAMGSARNKELAGEVHVHEFGHSFAGLADEYAANGFSNEFYSSEREPWEENITTLFDFSKKEIWNNLLSKGVKIPTKIDRRSAKQVGVFEGAGYSEKGVYRPVHTCMMRSFDGDKTFCPVCQEAINEMINRYIK